MSGIVWRRTSSGLRTPDSAIDSAMVAAPYFILFQVRRRQNFKIKRVIEVVTVIRDLVRKIRDLALQRWAIVFFACRSWEFVRSFMLPQTFTHFECQV